MTLAVPGAADIIGAKEGEFDGWHPDNVAPFVGFLASPAAAGISGQVFVVWGDEVIRMTGWMPATSIRNGDRWTIDEIVARQADLFPGEHDTEIPLLRPTMLLRHPGGPAGRRPTTQRPTQLHTRRLRA
jgi:hypothetical protein